jgi:hypothetical protein
VSQIIGISFGKLKQIVSATEDVMQAAEGKSADEYWVTISKIKVRATNN